MEDADALSASTKPKYDYLKYEMSEAEYVAKLAKGIGALTRDREVCQALPDDQVVDMAKLPCCVCAKRIKYIRLVSWAPSGCVYS